MNEKTYNAKVSRTKIKSFIIVFIITLCTCIDPFKPNLSGYASLLVVEGLITNEKAPYEVHLSRTMRGANSVAERVTDAIVSVFDETGHKTNLKNYSGGVYKTDSTTFIGAVGKTYTLDIITHDGKEYKSEQCTMLPVPEIDSIYFEKSVGFTNNQNETHEGISIYLDSKEGDETNNYLRWEYEETWKFRLPTIKRFNYISETNIPPLPYWDVKEFCWKQNKSTEILFQSFSPKQAGSIKNVPITFIGSDQSDRLTIQYSILVKQYSISEKEYQFWNSLKKVNESSGDIFGSQPFSVFSNITNVHDKNEKVLGYFEVSAVSQKRKDITFKDLLNLNLPFFHYDCVRYETKPSDYCPGGTKGCIPPTWDELYKMWTKAQFIFIEPYIDPETKKLAEFIFASAICSDCEITGTLVKPSFWIDLN